MLSHILSEANALLRSKVVTAATVAEDRQQLDAVKATHVTNVDALSSNRATVTSMRQQLRVMEEIGGTLRTEVRRTFNIVHERQEAIAAFDAKVKKADERAAQKRLREDELSAQLLREMAAAKEQVEAAKEQVEVAEEKEQVAKEKEQVEVVEEKAEDEDEEKPRPKRRRKSATLALREIRKLQNSTDLLIPNASLRKVAKGVAQKRRLGTRLAGDASLALQESAEAFLIGRVQSADLIAHHSGRGTVMPRDIQLAEHIQAKYHY